jgi:hypothetical protein
VILEKRNWFSQTKVFLWLEEAGVLEMDICLNTDEGWGKQAAKISKNDNCNQVTRVE